MKPAHATDFPDRRLAFATHVLPAAGYVCVIFYTGLIRLGRLPPLGFIATDKLLHALAFGGLALLLARATHWFRSSHSLVKKLACGALGSSFLGFLLELCQAFTVYRSADVWDWVADSIGALLAVSCLFLVSQWVPRRVHG